MFGTRGTAEGLKPWSCLAKKSPNIPIPFRTTPTILGHCLGQMTKCTLSCFGNLTRVPTEAGTGRGGPDPAFPLLLH